MAVIPRLILYSGSRFANRAADKHRQTMVTFVSVEVAMVFFFNLVPISVTQVFSIRFPSGSDLVPIPS
jgi:hypothetical protein